MWNEVLEDLIVVKRSGQRVNFNASKIAIAVKNAFDSVYEESDEKKIYKIFEKVLSYINDNYRERKTINVEDIQDIIESKLQSEKCLDVYNSFSEYRKKRAASRKVFAEKQQHKFVKAVEKIQENNNLKTDSYLSPYNTLYKFGKIVSSEFNKSYTLDTKFVRATEEGNIFIHDLDFFGLGLLSSTHLKIDFDLEDLNSIDDLINMVTNAHNEINGEIGINAIDYLLEPWLIQKYHKQIKLYLNNYLKVCGFISFINMKKVDEIIDKSMVINIDLNDYEMFMSNDNLKNIFKCAFEDSKDELYKITNNVLIKIFNALESKHQIDAKYTISLGTNNSEIGKLINKTIYELLIGGPSYSRVNVVYKIKKETKDIINYASDLILNKKNVSLSFIHNSYNKGINEVEYFSNGTRIYENDNDDVCISTGRMVVGTTSINLARLGLKYRNKNIKDFYTELDQISEIVKNELLLSFETIGNKNEANYEVLFNGNIFDDVKLEGNQKIRKVIKNGVLNIGLIGLKECVMCLENDPNKQYDLLINILKEMNKKCTKYMEETKLNFGICEPNDYKSRKSLIAIDKAIYGIDNITDKDSYDLIDSLKVINNDYEKLGSVQKLLKNGEGITINLASNITSKRINDLINTLIDADIGFVRMKVGK